MFTYYVVTSFIITAIFLFSVSLYWKEYKSIVNSKGDELPIAVCAGIGCFVAWPLVLPIFVGVAIRIWKNKNGN